MTRGGPLTAVSLVVVAILAATALFLVTRPPDPLTVVRAWTDARNRGDVDAAMATLGETGDILGIGIHLPGGREKLRAILEGQALAGYTVEDSDCRADGDAVTCRYVQRDRILDAWAVTLVGEHRYTVRDGKLVRAARTHDPESRAHAYAIFDDFRAWVRTAHPELYDVIWVDRTSAIYTTAAGAEAILDVLDEYRPPAR